MLGCLGLEVTLEVTNIGGVRLNEWIALQINKHILKSIQNYWDQVMAPEKGVNAHISWIWLKTARCILYQL